MLISNAGIARHLVHSKFESSQIRIFSNLNLLKFESPQIRISLPSNLMLLDTDPADGLTLSVGENPFQAIDS